MGTRNLTIVYNAEGTLKVAQYGQWDGYPSGQGKAVLEFLKSDRFDIFANYRLRKCVFIEEGEYDLQMHPQFSRNLGGHILTLIAHGPDAGIKLINSIDFAADGLFCEYGYLVDFQQKVFEVYKGGGTHCEGRFAHLIDPDKKYAPITLIASYPLDALPTLEDFLKLEDEPAAAE